MDDCNGDFLVCYNHLSQYLQPTSGDVEVKKKIYHRTKEMDLRYSQPLGKTISKLESVNETYFLSRATATSDKKKIGDDSHLVLNNPNTNVTFTEPYCHIKLNSVMELKDSTKKILSLLEDIQSKTGSNQFKAKPIKNITEDETDKSNEYSVYSVKNVCATALKKLETQNQILENIVPHDEDDDCSVYKRLTRKCTCLNQQEYNDLVIHFNEFTKYDTSITGEVIKNLRILKKFLYMGGGYSKHALMFLNEGLEFCSFNEKVEITQGCIHADMCNVFEDISIVISCIAWPIKYDSYGDSVTQELAAAFLYKMSQFEEGRRYLLFTSKITNNIKKVLIKKKSKLNYQTIESLEATLDALHPNVTENCNIVNTMPEDQGYGYGYQTLKELIKFRKYMTLCDICVRLSLLEKFSAEENGKKELTRSLGDITQLFREMLVDYDDSNINILITKILYNIVSKSFLTEKEANYSSKILTVAHIATEPIRMKTQCLQVKFPKKLNTQTTKTSYRLKSYMKDFSSAKISKQQGKYKCKRPIVVPNE